MMTLWESVLVAHRYETPQQWGKRVKVVNFICRHYTNGVQSYRKSDHLIIAVSLCWNICWSPVPLQYNGLVIEMILEMNYMVSMKSLKIEDNIR